MGGRDLHSYYTIPHASRQYNIQSLFVVFLFFFVHLVEIFCLVSLQTDHFYGYEAIVNNIWRTQIKSLRLFIDKSLFLWYDYKNTERIFAV